MTNANHYDVIIIGTGAGGGTLACSVNLESKYQTKEIWKDRNGKELHPHTNYWVGGNTKFYGAALFRMRREDFGEIRHHGGVSPAWPISYDELEPYYTEAEMAKQLGPEYSDLTAAVRQAVPENYRLVLAHKCGYDGRMSTSP